MNNKAIRNAHTVTVTEPVNFSKPVTLNRYFLDLGETIVPYKCNERTRTNRPSPMSTADPAAGCPSVDGASDSPFLRGVLIFERLQQIVGVRVSAGQRG